MLGVRRDSALFAEDFKLGMDRQGKTSRKGGRNQGDPHKNGSVMGRRARL
jgi:hypothetical protein